MFNGKQIEAMLTQRWICPCCGAEMIFEDDNEDILVCLSCGNSIDLDRYGYDSDEEYEKAYPSFKEVLAREGIFMDEEDSTDG
jgi:DNA-directed RNA polymerase subunit M/transcription elongation factor TFIIS